MSRPGRIGAALGRNNVWMKAKMNRYYLSRWDVGKRSLYVEKEKASKISGQWVVVQCGFLHCGVILSSRFSGGADLPLDRPGVQAIPHHYRSVISGQSSTYRLQTHGEMLFNFTGR